jgi:hypothetical protein
MGEDLLFIMFRPAVGPSQHPVRWVLAALSQALKWPQHEIDHLLFITQMMYMSMEI